MTNTVVTTAANVQIGARSAKTNQKLFKHNPRELKNDFWQSTSEECCFPSSLRRISVSTILRGLRDHVADQVQLSPHALIVPFLFSCNTLICKLRRRTVLLSAKLLQIAIDHNLFDTIHLLETSQSRTTETLNFFSLTPRFPLDGSEPWLLVAAPTVQ